MIDNSSKNHQGNRLNDGGYFASITCTLSLFALLVMHIAFGDLFTDDSQPTTDVVLFLRMFAPFQTVYIVFNILAYRYIIRSSADNANSPDAEYELKRWRNAFKSASTSRASSTLGPSLIIHCFGSATISSGARAY